MPSLTCEIDVPGVIRALGKNSKSERAIPWRTSRLPHPQPIHFHLRIWREQERDSATPAFSSACPSFGLAFFFLHSADSWHLRGCFSSAHLQKLSSVVPCLAFQFVQRSRERRHESPRLLSPWQKGGKSPFVGQGTTRENKPAIVPGISRRPPTS